MIRDASAPGNVNTAAAGAPERPVPLAFNPGGIPADLQKLRQFVGWAYELPKGRVAWTKEPYQIGCREHAKTNVSQTWSRFEDAVRLYRWRGYDGVGFVFSEDDPFCGIDLDDCRDPETGVIADWAKEILADLDSYSEVSPSRTGVKVIVRAKLPGGGKRRGYGGGVVEMYDKLRYFALTGHRVEGTPAEPQERQAVVEAWYAKAFPEKARAPSNGNGNGHPHVGGGLDAADAEVIRRAMGAKNGDAVTALWCGDTSAYLSHSEADLGLCNRLAFWSGPDKGRLDRLFRQSGLMRPKWDRRHFADGRTYGQATVDLALDGRTEFYSRGRRAPFDKAQPQAKGDGQPDEADHDEEEEEGGKRREFSNFYIVEQEQEGGEGEEKKAVKLNLGYSAEHLTDELLDLTGGWPKRVGPLLFVPDGNAPLYLENPNSLFAWIGGQLSGSGESNPIRWANQGADKLSKGEFFACLRQRVENYQTVEGFPHYPKLPEVYYLHPPLEGGDGSALNGLLDRFKPASPLDKDLALGLYLSLVAGLPPGSRPAWTVQADKDDERSGRGVGKTTFLEVAAELVGGYITVRPKDDMGTLVERLLSPEGRGKRLLIIDNLKSLRFSSDEIEALITSSTISGKMMYVGEGQVPNHFTVGITVNGASFSKDLAQRSAFLELSRPDYDAGWRENVSAYIAERRWAILGDLVAVLQQTSAPLARYSRWAGWERLVLSRLPKPDDAQKVIEERQGAVDDDSNEADLVRQAFVAELKTRGHSVEEENVFLTSAQVACIMETATAEKRATNKAGAHLATLCIRELRRSAKDGARGWQWCGRKAGQKPAVLLNDQKPDPKPEGESAAF